MKSLLKNLFGISIGLLLVSFLAEARAQPADERILLVGVNKGRGSDARLVEGLGEHLQHAGLLLVDGALSASDRSCESLDCLMEIANRASAPLAISAKLQENAARAFYITMALYDAARKKPFQETALCDQCDQDALIDKLSDVADRLIKQCREARRTPVPAALPEVATPVPLISIGLAVDRGHGQVSGGPPQSPARGYFAQLSRGRKITATVLGGLAGATLFASIALTATNGQRTSLGCALVPNAVNDYCELHDVPIFATGYALTGALVLGVGLTLFWPSSTPKSSVEEVR